MGRVSYAIVLDEQHCDGTVAMAKRLARRGFEVKSVLPEIGAIYGSAEESLAVKIRGMDGIEEVREEAHVSLPPFSERCPQ